MSTDQVVSAVNKYRILDRTPPAGLAAGAAFLEGLETRLAPAIVFVVPMSQAIDGTQRNRRFTLTGMPGFRT
jgi:hypothetical protein